MLQRSPRGKSEGAPAFRHRSALPTSKSTRWIRRVIACLAVATILISLPAGAWNANADRLITNQAVNTLPDDIRPFFEASRQFLVQHVTDARDELARAPSTKPFHYIDLDHYAPFPYTALPRDYKAATAKFSRIAIAAHGQLPWQIGLYSARLTDSFRARNWDASRVNAAFLAYYVAEAHDPFNTTAAINSHAAPESRVDHRFGSSLFDRYSLFFFTHPNAATYVPDPTDHAFEMCLTAHSYIEQILLADARARQGLPDYTDEYYDRFYNQAGAILVRQLSDAATDVGSYWLTSWTNAGKPSLPGH
jgi:hypothetical protein